jgi:SAM-dependent methyltransferase
MTDVVTEGRGGDWAKQAFEAMAPDYDDFTAHYEYEFWTGQLLEILKQDGLQGRRLLDAGCGTGKSFLPLLARGWKITGYDISASMLERAEQKGGKGVRLEVADMRKMPRFGEFDLVWALDDAINYLLSFEELLLALSGFHGNLAATGLLLFDVNELPLYHALSAESIEVERDGRRLVWQGTEMGSVEDGSICEFSCFEAKGAADASQPAEKSRLSIHRQRYFSEAEILAAIDQAGLECLSVYGQSTDGIPRRPLNDEIHTKAIYVARAL